MNRAFKNINIFLAQTSFFSKKKFENLNIFDRNLWIFSKNHLKIFKFNETYKSSEICGEFLLSGWEIYSGAERNFSGGTLGPLKGDHAPPAGGPGAKAPRTVAKFHFSNDAKYFKNETSFQKYQYFSCPKTLFFLRKIRKIEHIWREFMNFFEQLFENFQFLWNL